MWVGRWVGQILTFWNYFYLNETTQNKKVADFQRLLMFSKFREFLFCSPTWNRTRIYSLGNCYSIR